MIRRLRSLWRRLRRRRDPDQAQSALAQARLELALRAGTDPSSIRVGPPKREHPCHPSTKNSD